MPNGFKKIFTGYDFNGSRVTGLGDPVNNSDAVTLSYLGNSLASRNYKDPVIASATANIDLTNPPATFDGIAATVGGRYLVPRQTDATQNGVYVYRGPGTPMTRAQDMNSGRLFESAVVVVAQGTATDINGDLLYGDREWLQRSDNVTLGTTSILFIPLPGRGLPYTNGNGIGLQGNTFSVTPGKGILVDSAGVRVDPSYAVTKYAADLPALAAGTAVTVTHNLSTPDITYSLILVATGEFIDADVVRKDANSLTVTSYAALAAGAVRIVVHG